MESPRLFHPAPWGPAKCRARAVTPICPPPRMALNMEGTRTLTLNSQSACSSSSSCPQSHPGPTMYYNLARGAVREEVWGLSPSSCTGWAYITERFHSPRFLAAAKEMESFCHMDPPLCKLVGMGQVHVVEASVLQWQQGTWRNGASWILPRLQACGHGSWLGAGLGWTWSMGHRGSVSQPHLMPLQPWVLTAASWWGRGVGKAGERGPTGHSAVAGCLAAPGRYAGGPSGAAGFSLCRQTLSRHTE